MLMHYGQAHYTARNRRVHSLLLLERGVDREQLSALLNNVINVDLSWQITHLTMIAPQRYNESASKQEPLFKR